MSEYRYKKFTTSLLFRDLRFARGAADAVREAAFATWLQLNTTAR